MAAKNMNDIAKILKRLKFNKRFFGGVDEIDVWRKLEALHREYQSAFDVQEELARIKLEEKDAEIALLKQRIAAMEATRGVMHDR